MSFALFPTNANEIINIVAEFDNKSSSGTDEIPVFLIKQVISSVAVQFAFDCNASFETGKMPDLLKIAQICPVFKKGAKMTFKTIGPFLFYQRFPKLLRS